MDKVYTSLIDKILSPLTGLGDDEDAVRKYRSFNPNNQSEVKQLIKSVLSPHFANLGAREQQLAKLCLRYYLSEPNTPFRAMFDAILPPFNLGEDAHKFFFLCWQVLFGTEQYLLENRDQYIVDNRVDVTYLSPDIYDMDRSS